MARPVLPLSHYVAKYHKTQLIFDMDATLVLMHFPWSEWGDTMRDALVAIDPEPWQHYMEHRKIGRVQNEYVAKYGDKALAIVLEHARTFEARMAGFSKNDDLLRHVQALNPTHKMYIWSSNMHAVVDDVLSQAGLQDWFEKIVARDDVRMIKPDREGFNLIYDPAVSKADFLMIGDSSYDRAAAEAVGIDFYHTDFFKLGI